MNLPKRTALRGIRRLCHDARLLIMSSSALAVLLFIAFVVTRVVSGEFASSWTESERAVEVALFAAALVVLAAVALLFSYAHRCLIAEREAENASTLLRSTMDNISVGVLMFDRRHRVLAWNERYLQLRKLLASDIRKGLPGEELLKRAAPLILTVGDQTLHSHDAMSVLGDLTQAAEAEAVDQTGTVFLMSGRPIANGNYIVTITDITALRNSEEAYKDRAARLTSTLDNVVDAIVTINESGSIESWSRGAQRMFGYTPEEVLHRNIKILMPEPHASAHNGYLRNYLIGGQRKAMGARRQAEALHKDGRRIPVDLGISEMYIGERRLFVGIVRDISERLEVERMKSSFVSTVSHELRTPLTSIGGSLGLLAAGAAGELSAKAARLVEIARQNSSRLVALINDILDLEKAESGKLELRLEQQPLQPILAQAIELNRGYAQSFGVHLEIETTHDDVSVFVDRDRFIQVLTNLISNAVKYSPKEGIVRLSLRKDADRAVVSVFDQGPGIPAAFEARIFQKFSQADSSDARAKAGTGLGLSIAKTFMERFGGTINFERNRTNGAHFFVTLPTSVLSRSQMQADGGGEGARVLMCEDDPDAAQLVSDTLELAGMSVEHAPTATLARTASSQDHFDLALIDVHLPDANGLNLIRDLRSNPATARLPVIVMTAGRSEGDKESLAKLKLSDWLQKPVDPVRLISAIRRAVAAQRLHRLRVLHVEDDTSITEVVGTLLESVADVVPAHSLASARERFAHEDFDLVILDIELGDGSGTELLPELYARAPGTPAVLLYTATEPSNSLASAVDGFIVKSRTSISELLSYVQRLSSAEAA